MRTLQEQAQDILTMVDIGEYEYSKELLNTLIDDLANLKMTAPVAMIATAPDGAELLLDYSKDGKEALKNLQYTVQLLGPLSTQSQSVASIDTRDGDQRCMHWDVPLQSFAHGTKFYTSPPLPSAPDEDFLTEIIEQIKLADLDDSRAVAQAIISEWPDQ